MYVNCITTHGILRLSPGYSSLMLISGSQIRGLQHGYKHLVSSNVLCIQERQESARYCPSESWLYVGSVYRLTLRWNKYVFLACPLFIQYYKPWLEDVTCDTSLLKDVLRLGKAWRVITQIRKCLTSPKVVFYVWSNI